MLDSRTALPAKIVLDGSYEIQRVLGIGGFGITYEAFDRGLGRPVAVKEYYPAEIGTRVSAMSVRPRTEKDRELFEKLRTSFTREARTLSQFAHPAIVRVLRIFEAHGTAYMVMDLERGATLKQWLAELGRPPTQAELDRLVAPLLGALELMHESNFLHRDVAPDNIIVRADGSPVLLDFGATRRVAAELTSAFTGLVKRGYSPMEQYAQDGRAQGPWTDIYALGATLYRCVAGREPQEATLRVLGDAEPSATVVGEGNYRHEFLAAIDKAIAIRPEDRPRSIAELRRAMQVNDPLATSPGGGVLKAAAYPGKPEDVQPVHGRKSLAWIVPSLVLLMIAGAAVAYREFTQRPAPIEQAHPAADASRAPESATGPLQSSPATVRAAVGEPTRADAVSITPCDGIFAKVLDGARCLKTGEVFSDCTDCPEMIVVPAGKFIMGAPETETGSLASERPARTVTIARPFAISRYEVTRKEFESYLARENRKLEKGCTDLPVNAAGRVEQRFQAAWSWEDPGYSQTSFHPVVCVSWTEAREFVEALARTTSHPYRLPTEAEWEYAARAGSQSRFFFGDAEGQLCDYGNVYDAGSNRAAPGRTLVPCKDYALQSNVVGTYKPNAFGLYDTIGNVWEWVADCSQPSYADAPTGGTAVEKPSCTRRIARGGSFGSHGGNARSANRWLNHTESIRMLHVGFRVARALD